MLNKKESNMENWEHKESIKELKSEIAKVKRSHKYFEEKLRDELGLDFDMSYVMNRETEKKYLEILIPLLKESL